MDTSSSLLAFARVAAFYVAVIIMLFLGFSMLLRSVTLTRGTRGVARTLVYLLGALYLISAILFLILPRMAIIPAGVAVAGSLVLGAVLGKTLRISVGEHEAVILFLLPAFLGVFLFYYYPIVQTVIYSFHELKYTAKWLEAPFVGLDNYVKVMQSKNFLNAAGFTFFFTITAVFVEFWIGLGMALTTFAVPRKLSGILRAVIVIPWAIPPIINASIWRWLLNADVGLGAILKQIGLVKEAPIFLADPTLAMASVIVADIWKNSSIIAIFLLGGLAIIPQDIYDAAKVDGARGWFRFRRITLPMVAPTIIVALLFRSMDALRTFDLVYGLTGGGPGTTTETLSSFAYKYYFSYSRFGLGSAYAMVVFVLIMVLSLFYISRIRRNLRFRS
jgi:multiple sugar transport system permease protein